MRRQNDISTIYSVGFVCEGEKTEPYFVRALYDKVKSQLAHVYSIDVHPAPVEEEQTEVPQSGRRRRSVEIQNKPEADPLIKAYQGRPQPESWVYAGEELLGKSNEVWVMFDKDGHPHMREAFEKIKELREQGKRFNVVFSSLCFEHYMLLHYEWNATAFEDCECHRKENGKTVYAHCQSKEAKDWGCDGTQCLNGYARAHGYWEKSKNPEAFKQCRNLWWGILNAFHLKWFSICAEPITYPLYVRNPYLNIYQLTLRMMEIVSLEPFVEVRMDKGHGQYHLLSRNGDVLHFECQSDIKLKKEIEIRIFKLPTEEELGEIVEQKRQFFEKDPISHTINLNLDFGENMDVDLASLLPDKKHYGKFEFGGITYFVAPVLQQVPSLTPEQLDALRIITVDEKMIKTM